MSLTEIWSLCMLYKKAKSQQTQQKGMDVTLMKGMEADHIKYEQFYSWTNSLR